MYDPPMRNAIASVLFIASIAGATATVSRASDARQPVVVELFTSEGCSDCPPADEILNAMARRSENDAVIPLAFHVTYWDTAAWRDRFSDARFTNRQETYQGKFHLPSVYTPQLIIDGRFQTVGNDARSIDTLLRRASTDPKPVTVNVATTAGSVTIDASSSDPAVRASVLLAITEDDLSTDVKGGENRSRTLRHSAVVRSLEDLGAVTGGRFSRVVPLKTRRDWRRNNLHAVVLVQDGDGHVLGAGQAGIQGE